MTCQLDGERGGGEIRHHTNNWSDTCGGDELTALGYK